MVAKIIRSAASSAPAQSKVLVTGLRAILGVKKPQSRVGYGLGKGSAEKSRNRPTRAMPRGQIFALKFLAMGSIRGGANILQIALLRKNLLATTA